MARIVQDYTYGFVSIKSPTITNASSLKAEVSTEEILLRIPVCLCCLTYKKILKV